MSSKAQPKLTVPVNEGDHIQGVSQATVTLVEYGDYECQYCGKVHPIIQDLVHRLGQQQIRYIFRHFPIRSIHAHAMLAAEAAEAAGSQGKFWEMHDLLFDAHGELTRTDLLSYAETLELDLNQFEHELDSHMHAEKIEADFYSGVRSGVNGTPTFFVNGSRYDGAWDLESLLETVLHWVNDGLMAIFFFVVGLEIKREITAGELATKRKAALPIAAALGGMILPALLYLVFNFAGPNASGWGIPMATDIAFTLGIMALLGRRVPLSLKVFFTALAIADDIGAVLVIAVFYTAHIEWLALAIGGLILVALFGMNRARVYSPLPYAVLGILLWLAFLESGVHPTIAGVLLAFTIPTRSPAISGPYWLRALRSWMSMKCPRRRCQMRRAASNRRSRPWKALLSAYNHRPNAWNAIFILGAPI